MSNWRKSVFAGLEREALIRFFAALLALTLAFGAALFSTVTRDAGNVIGTAVLASVALLLAGWVALTTVPYLARRVAIARKKPSRVAVAAPVMAPAFAGAAGQLELPAAA